MSIAFTIHWWMWFAIPALILLVGYVMACVSEANDSGMSSGLEGALIILGSMGAAICISIGLLIGHFA